MRTIALLVILSTLAQAAEPLRVTWQQVPFVCADRTALVKLASGTRLEGRFMSVNGAFFDMEVASTSNKTAVPKGLRRLERASIAVLRVRDKRIRGRVAGTTAGVFFAGPAVYSMSAGAAMAVGLPVYVGIIALGHLVGRGFDYRSRLVVIEEDGAALSGGLAAGETFVEEAEDVHSHAGGDQ